MEAYWFLIGVEVFILLGIVFKLGQIYGLKEGYRHGRISGYMRLAMDILQSELMDHFHADPKDCREQGRIEIKSGIGLVGEKETHGDQTGDTPKTKQ